MTWAEAFPNFLIGLREGLEAGLVVSILLAALRKVAPGDAGDAVSSAPIWFGVLGAVMLAGSFAAVLTFSTDVLSSRAQQAVGGVLSVLAVALVTAMIFWMRRTAATLSKQLRGEVARAAVIGTGALTLTAFVAISREGLETTLFLWTAVKASGSTLAPLIGAALGLAAAVTLCWLMFRQAVRINLGVFFNRTAILLIVIAAGVLAYGLGDLQEAGVLPGQQWVAFDLSAHVDANAWWASIVTGVTELSPVMTVLQAVAWVGYLVVVVGLFVTAGRQVPAPVTPAPAAAPPATAPTTAEGPRRWERFTRRRPWLVAGTLVVVPALVAALVIVALPSSSANATSVSITSSGCADGWSSARAGFQTFQVQNSSSKAGEVRLVNSAGGIVAEIETIGPATTADLSASLGSGSYSFTCLMSGNTTMRSPTVEVTGGATGTTGAIAPITVGDLAAPNRAYQAYARATLTTLSHDIAIIRADLARGDLKAARTHWWAAQREWERVGASYDSFGAAGVAVDGLPDGLPGGVHDTKFTGLHRLEYGLWHHQSAAELQPVTATLATDVATVQKNLTNDDLAGDPTTLPLRAHEIIEDALRDHLSGLDNQGSGAAYAMTDADADATRRILGELAPLITARNPTLVATADRQLNTLDRAVRATRNGGSWVPADRVRLADRQAVNGAVGALLETLSAVPDLLETPPSP